MVRPKGNRPCGRGVGVEERGANDLDLSHTYCQTTFTITRGVMCGSSDAIVAAFSSPALPLSATFSTTFPQSFEFLLMVPAAPGSGLLRGM